MPMNERGEFASDPFNPVQNLAALERKRFFDNPFRATGPMSEGSRAWNKATKSINKAVNMSKESKEIRSRYQDMGRKLELKKMRGEPITEQEVKAMWAAQDAITDLETRQDHFYNAGRRTHAVKLGTTPKKTTWTMRGRMGGMQPRAK
jgi:hypothetical protein